MRKIQGILSVLIAFSFLYGDDDAHEKNFKKQRKKPDAVKNVKDFTGRILSDIGADLYNLFSWNTFNVACVGIPLYIAARPADHKIQKHLYDPVLHENIHQPSKVFSEIALHTAAIVIPIVALRDFFSHDLYHNRRGEIFIGGLALTWITKNIIKHTETEGNKRPWNGNFSSHSRAYGGNPSGHSALFGYVTSFWFLEKGLIVGIPLMIATGFEMAASIVTNRHYLSQTILGVTYGVVFGFAAHKTLEKTIFNENTKIGLVANPSTGLGLKLSYNF